MELRTCACGATEASECPCVREGGCCHAPGVCLHGCREAADDLTRLGQEMEAPETVSLLPDLEGMKPVGWTAEWADGVQPLAVPRRPPYTVAYAVEGGHAYEIALPGDASVVAEDGVLKISHPSAVLALTQVQPFMNTEQ